MLYAQCPVHFSFAGSVREDRTSWRKYTSYLLRPFEDYLRLAPTPECQDTEIRMYMLEQDVSPYKNAATGYTLLHDCDLDDSWAMLSEYSLRIFFRWLLGYYFQYFRLGTKGTWARMSAHAPTLKRLL